MTCYRGCRTRSAIFPRSARPTPSGAPQQTSPPDAPLGLRDRQDGPEDHQEAQGGPRTPQDHPRRRQDAPRGLQEAPGVPNRLPEALGSRQDAPRSPRPLGSRFLSSPRFPPPSRSPALRFPRGRLDTPFPALHIPSHPFPAPPVSRPTRGPVRSPAFPAPPVSRPRFPASAACQASCPSPSVPSPVSRPPCRHSFYCFSEHYPRALSNRLHVPVSDNVMETLGAEKLHC